MIATRVSDEQSIVLENISWETYERLLREVGERHIRLTYNDGDLEIRTLSFEHEKSSEFLGRMVAFLTAILGISISSGGMTTLKKKLRKKGLEPDKCFWIQHAAAMRGKRRFIAKKDPAPDLALEIDVSRSSLSRLPIYAALSVREIWHYDGKSLLIYLLGKVEYEPSPQSEAFPFLPMERFADFLPRSLDEDETALILEFADWVRDEILPKYNAGMSRSGRKK